jgi:hypothetical protein|tara:strand:- start:28 stop:1176 length:1149 start_codon:yes stop_codon:yes gene_type:complete
MKKILKGKWSELWFTCPELTYYDLTFENKDLNSIEKISDAIDDVILGGEGESTAHLVLGKLGHYKIPHSDLDYLDMETSDVDITEFTTENKGRLIENPKKGEVVFVYFYYYDHAYNVLTKNENFKKISFEFKSFKNEAVLTGQDYSGFDLTLNDSSGGGEYQLEIIFSNGQSFLGTPEGKDKLIEKLNDYLTEKNERELAVGSKVQKKNGSIINFTSNYLLQEDEYDSPAYRNSVNEATKNFVNDFKEKAEEFYGEKIAIGEKILISDGSNLHELEKWTKNGNEIDSIYVLLINEISADDLNGVFLSMNDYGFYAVFTSDDKLINQGYDRGEYDTGYFNMEDEEAYIEGYINEDGDYNSTSNNEYELEEIAIYNKAMEILKE